MSEDRDVVDRLRELDADPAYEAAGAIMHLREENTALRARIAEMEAERAWKPIEDAPTRDVVILMSPDWGFPKTGWQNALGDWTDGFGDRLHLHDGLPTHWRPLPAPPKDIP